MSDFSYVAVTNIPHTFRAADLRAHFTDFVENGSFICFHFRHRPEKSNVEKQHAQAKRCCCVVKIRSSRLNNFQQKYNRELWTDDSNTYYADRCQISPLRLSGNNSDSENSDECIEEEKILAMSEMKPPELMPNGNVGTPTLVFLDLVQRCLLPDRLIKTLKLKFPKTEGKRIYSNVSFHYDERGKGKRRCQTKPELNCSISKPSCSSTESSLSLTDRCGDNSHIGSDCTNGGTNAENLLSQNCIDDKNAMTKRELKKLERKETLALLNEGIEERLIGVEKKYHNDEDAEEWDRHEASEDDPSNQERNKERLYEEEIEQPWEKGGPGVVFYTDAMYWQARGGDFDEQTTDDLDVDFSPYEGEGPGDKDIQDFLKIRQERRFRSGYDKTDRFSIGIGKKITNNDMASPVTRSASLFKQPHPKNRIGQFAIHTKGIGRKILEKQGWTDGQGLGRSQSGIKEALKGEGQKPRVKKGLGFVETKPVIYGPSNLKKAKLSASRHITTSMDNPNETDGKEMMLQRQEPTTLKYRKSFLDNFSPGD